jgi:hypothetical protein
MAHRGGLGARLEVTDQTSARWVGALLAATGVLTTIGLYPLASDFPVVFPKLVVLAIAAALVLPWVCSRRDEGLPWSASALRGALLVLVLAFALKVAQQPQHYLALWGISGRNIAALLYMALAVLAAAAASTPRFTSRVLHSSFLAAGVVTTVYGVSQHFGHDFIRWRAIGPLTTFGNIDHAGSWFAMVTVAAAAAVTQRDRHLATRAAAALMALAALWMVVILYRPPWRIDQGPLVLMAGTIALTVSAFRTSLGAAIKRWLPLALVLGVAGLVAVAAVVVPTNGFKHRAWLWAASLQMFESHPLVGVGLARYSAFYFQARSAGEMRYFGPENYADDAHGVPVHLLGTGGLLVALPYLLVMGIMVWGALHALLKRSEARTPSLNVTATLCLLYWLQASFSPEMSGIAVWGWLAGGVALREVALDRPRWWPSGVSSISAALARIPRVARLGAASLVSVALLWSVATQVRAERTYLQLGAWLRSRESASKIRAIAERQKHRTMAEFVMRVRPGDYPMTFQLMNVLRNSQDADGARIIAEYTLSVEPNALGIVQALSEMYRSAEKPQESFYWQVRATEIAPTVPSYWMYRANVGAWAGDSVDARRSLAKSESLAVALGDSSMRFVRAREVFYLDHPWAKPASWVSGTEIPPLFDAGVSTLDLTKPQSPGAGSR